MAIYCPDQHVVHDGITKSKDKCLDCVKADQELLPSMEEDHKDDRSDLRRTHTGFTRVEDDGKGPDFAEDCFANGSQAYVPRDCDGSAMWSSNEEWQLVQHRESERQQTIGREDEMVVVDHDGEIVNEPLHVVGESEWMIGSQILPRPTIPDDQELNTEGTGRRECGELGTGRCVGGGGRAAPAGRRRRDPTSSAKLAWGKQEEQNGARVWKPTWRTVGLVSWVKEQYGGGIH